MAEKNTAPKNFGFGEDEAMLRDLARKFLDETLPVETLRRLVAEAPEPIYDEGQRPPWDEALWKEIVELGWTGLAVGEEEGGAAISLAGIAGVVEEVGRHALPSPLVPTLSATLVLREARGEVAKSLLARIAGGCSATLALTGERGSWDPDEPALAARTEGDGLVLEGQAHFVQDAFKADVLITSARLGDDVVLCAVEKGESGLELQADHIHDLTRDQATVRFEDVHVETSSIVSRNGLPALRRAWPGILVLVSADLCGSSEWQLQTTVEYAKARKQFDRQIGFFQAVKHPLVDAMVEIDRARSLLYHAACEIDRGSDEAETAARMAKSAASDAGAFISDRSVQLHGGIGFTWECDVHIFFKRSMHNQVLYGDGVHQRKKLADHLIGPTPRRAM
ncbi:MAG: acyl-CoA dehydrogenase family protein [Myxococcota bacterium]|nr:acyl-CoA dehydrogenase family protein [Myxococcota bacterium]